MTRLNTGSTAGCWTCSPRLGHLVPLRRRFGVGIGFCACLGVWLLVLSGRPEARGPANTIIQAVSLHLMEGYSVDALRLTTSGLLAVLLQRPRASERRYR